MRNLFFLFSLLNLVFISILVSVEVKKKWVSIAVSLGFLLTAPGPLFLHVLRHYTAGQAAFIHFMFCNSYTLKSFPELEWVLRLYVQYSSLRVDSALFRPCRATIIETPAVVCMAPSLVDTLITDKMFSFFIVFRYDYGYTLYLSSFYSMDQHFFPKLDL